MKTQRSYTDVKTGERFDMYRDEQTGVLHLQNNSRTIKSFLVAAFTGVTYKFLGGKVVKLQMGKFYELEKGEKPTHLKYTGFKNFSKL